MAEVRTLIVSVNPYFMQTYLDKTVYAVAEYFVHQSLERERRVSKPHWHYQEPLLAVFGIECRPSYVCRKTWNLMKTRFLIEF